MNWETFIVSVLGSGVITALVNGWINNKAQIRAIKESGLYAKRAEVLDELMKRMERMDRLMGELVSPFQVDTSIEAEERRRKKANDAYILFVGFFKRSRHYLPRQLSDEINKLCDEYKEVFINFSWDARLLNEKPNIEKWVKLVKKHSDEFSKKRENVADEFRKIIGVK